MIAHAVSVSGKTIVLLLHQVLVAQILFTKKICVIFKRLSKTVDLFIRAHWPFVKDRLIQYTYLTRLHKPVGILLLLWPALWALWIAAEGLPNVNVLITFVLGAIVMRSAGCVINDLADRELDRHVRRTHLRPITSGTVTTAEALGLVVLLLIVAAILVTHMNFLTFKLSFIAVLLAIVYPLMKRITYLPQVFLGLTFGWAVPMAFAAQINTLPEIAWLLYITTVLWAVVYDTMYAMVDKSDDLKIGIKSTALLFDDADRLIIGIIQSMILCSQILIGSKLELGLYYYAGVLVASLLSLYQQYLIKDRIPKHCFQAFLNNQWYGLAIFVGLYMEYAFR